jgi:sugar/nucleoside kinase (ribokinase family)
MVELDYLVVGHVTRDLTDGGFTFGGTVSYAARTALSLSCRVGVVTSASADLDLGQVLSEVRVTRFPASTTTTFENIYTADGRRQVLRGVADLLVPEMVPSQWKTKIAHLGPVARECDPALVHAFGDAFVGVTPQGWMRQWDEAGRVSRRRWEEAEQLLVRADAVVLSEEDVCGDESLIAQYATQARLLVVTRGAKGCDVHTRGRVRSFPAPSVREIDPTGAGDIFAAAFFVGLQRSGDPAVAACFANCIASCSVTRTGLDGAPRPREVASCEQAWLEGCVAGDTR